VVNYDQKNRIETEKRIVMKKNLLILLFTLYFLNSYSQINVIEDGSFTAGVSSTAWASITDFYYNTQFSNGNGDSNYAYLANSSGNSGNNLNGFVYQPIGNSIPSNGITAGQLNFAVSITTTETTTTQIYDYLEARIFVDGTKYILEVISNLDAIDSNGSYQNVSVSLSLTIINAINNSTNNTIVLNFEGVTDGGSPSTIRLDDVELILTEDSSGNGNDFNIAVDNIQVSDTNPDIGQTINLSCDHIIEGDCGCSENFDPRPDVGFGWSTSSTFNSNNFNLIDTQSSTIGTDSGDPEDVDWTVPNSLEGQTIYIYFIPDYNDEYDESTEGEYSIVTVNVNSTNQNTNGNITVNLLPTNAVNNGARWKTTSTSAWLNSGETLTLPFGTYSLEFKEVNGWVEPSNQTLTISDSAPNYSNSFTYQEENTSNNSISGTFINPQLNNNFDLINGSTSGFIVKLYQNGSSTNLMEVPIINGLFNFDNVPNGNYNIKAEKYNNGTLVSSVLKGPFTQSNSNISLKSSNLLIEEINSNNITLKSLNCQWNSGPDSTKFYYNLEDDFTEDSYNTTNSELYIRNTAFIEYNDNEVIDKLARLAILTKATKEYFENACSISNEYLTTVSDANRLGWNLLNYLKCKGIINNTLTNNQISQIIQEGVIALYRWAFLELMSNGDYASFQVVKGSFDIMLAYVISAGSVDFTVYPATLTELGLVDNWIERFLKEGYIDYTYDSFNSSVSSIYNNSHTLSIEELGSSMNDRLNQIENIVTSTNINVTSYRNLDWWADASLELANIIGQSSCNNNVAISVSVLSDALEGIIIYDSFWHARQGRNTVRNIANNGILYTANKSFSDSQTVCTDVNIVPLINEFSGKINIYNAKINEITNSINDSSFNETLYNELEILSNDLNSIQQILTSTFITLEGDSSLDSIIYKEKLRTFVSSAPAFRLAYLINLKSLLINNDSENSANLVSNRQVLIDANLLGLSNLNDMKNSINNFSTPIHIGIVKNNIPILIENNVDNSYEINLINYGCDLAENVNLTISYTGNSVAFNQTTFQVGTISPFEIKTINIPISSSSTDGITEYNLMISNSEIQRNITVKNVEALNVSDYTQDEIIKIFPNPVDRMLNIDISNNEKINKIEIFNSLGGLVFQSNKKTERIDVKEFSTGLYIIKIYKGNSTVVSKFIKE
jgi:hypothetical protein